LWTDGEHGEKIGIYTAQNEETEADYVTFMINDLRRRGYEYNDFGLLFRMNSQSRVFEEKFRESDIPHKMIGATNFFDRPEIRDILAYIRFLANEEDEVALHRIINTPKRHIGVSTVMKIMEFSRKYNSGMFATIRDFVQRDYLGSKTTPTWRILSN
jgi:DNA helicase-2/ATP-dependent DNA helicase PcrA